MIGLAGLLSDDAGKDLLLQHAVHTDPRTFMDALRPPSMAVLASPSTHCTVFLHQQPCPDFAPSVLAKFDVLHAITQGQGISPAYVAIDTDRAASSKVAVRLSWREEDGRASHVRLVPPASKYMEFRHIRMAAGSTAAAEAFLAARTATWRSPLRDIAPRLAATEGQSYADYAIALATFLLERTYGLALPTLRVSELQDHPAVRASIRAVLAQRECFVAAFNRKIASFAAQGIGTAVAPLDDGYLPFFYSCPVDGERIRLRLDESRSEAVGTSRAGRRYSFPADDASLADRILDTGRGSLDVLLPVFLNPVFSGLVAGRSSALYCMVMRTALEDCLGERLMPLLVPAALGSAPADGRGLMQRWLEGAR